MPAYRFHPASAAASDAHSVEVFAYNDAVALRRAVGFGWEGGVDVWKGRQFVGRVHPPASASPRLLLAA